MMNGQKPDGPQPRVVEPGGPGQAPSDAVVLFDGKDTSHWTARSGRPGCTVTDGVLTCKTGSGSITSKEKFHDAQIHLEFAIPNMPDQHGQMRGNSGVYLQGRYEIQILDSYQNPTYANGSCGALYGQEARWSMFRGLRSSGKATTSSSTRRSAAPTASRWSSWRG